MLSLPASDHTLSWVVPSDLKAPSLSPVTWVLGFWVLPDNKFLGAALCDEQVILRSVGYSVLPEHHLGVHTHLSRLLYT